MRRNPFTTVRSEGALLPADFLQRLTDPKSDIEGLTPAAYHLSQGERLNEAASRSWNRLLGVWASFRASSATLKEADPASGLTREKWLLPLFHELGYGRLQSAKAIEIDGRAYPISHLWARSPIHLVGRGVDLETRSPGVAGAARATPHGLVQEFLNRSEGYLWGFVSNGLKLRVLRDSKSFTRQAFVEFDLLAIFEGQVYSDFALLWLVCHESRVEVEGDHSEQCWLERWTETARKEGTRALDRLRDGVEAAIKAFGSGLLRHPANRQLIEKLRAGSLTTQDYYRQLLRQVYRLIFVFVAEDRDLLLTTDPHSVARRRYADYYSGARLRALADRRRGTQHTDLWRGFTFVVRQLSSEAGCPELGLPTLGSFLWSDEAAPDLEACEVANTDLLDTVRALAFTIDRGARRAVDYRNLGPEELGSVYESLLELRPRVNADAATFDLASAAGSERKTTGSYYTPTSLIECLLDSALDPVLDEACRAPNPIESILSLKVCDPACGSGHFLIAAARRIAGRLAEIRTGDDEPSPDAMRHALRDVVGRCVYGVDMNQMAVELCKVNLWLEALEPGKPLSFLENRIQCGNAWLGATPELLKSGIPDEAFDALESEDREFCKALKKRNKQARAGQQMLRGTHGEAWEHLGNLALALMELDKIADDSADGIRAKEAKWSELKSSVGYEFSRLLADSWCAAFMWRKVPDSSAPSPITEDEFRVVQRNPMALPIGARREVRHLADEYNFFHWHLAFPHVFPSVNRLDGSQASIGSPELSGGDGFDVIIGNPPWERIQPEVVSFFTESHPELLDLERSARLQAIAALEVTEPNLYQRWATARRQYLAVTRFLKQSGRFPLSTQKNVNSYAVFLELGLTLVAQTGRAGLVLQSGVATDDINKDLFKYLVTSGRLVRFADFENRLKLFPAVDSRMRFCLVTCLGATNEQAKPVFLFGALSVVDLQDQERWFSLSPSELQLVSPNTGLSPTFRSRRDASITIALYRCARVFVDETVAGGNVWQAQINRIFSTSYDGKLFSSQEPENGDGWSRVYEAKMFHQFDHRFGTYGAGEVCTGVADAARMDVSFYVRPAAWVDRREVKRRLVAHEWHHDYLIGYRDIARATDERTCIATVLPAECTDDTIRIVFLAEDAASHACFVANLNSLVFDYAARNIVASTHLSEYIAKQLPVLKPEHYAVQCRWDRSVSVRKWLLPRVLELVVTAGDVASFATECGWGTPFRWNPERRLLIRSEIDAAFFHLYQVADSDVNYILDTFPIVHRNDEKQYGEHRTKLLIAEFYESMRRAIETGDSYVTVLDPPPADPRVAHPPGPEPLGP